MPNLEVLTLQTSIWTAVPAVAHGHCGRAHPPQFSQDYSGYARPAAPPLAITPRVRLELPLGADNLGRGVFSPVLRFFVLRCNLCRPVIFKGTARYQRRNRVYVRRFSKLANVHTEGENVDGSGRFEMRDDADAPSDSRDEHESCALPTALEPILTVGIPAETGASLLVQRRPVVVRIGSDGNGRHMQSGSALRFFTEI
jgi:hypothetical protein